MMDAVVRCPYCAVGLAFRPMVGHLDGRFICEKCGHLAFPGNANFHCSCPRCQELNSKRMAKSVNPALKIKTLVG